MKRAGLLLGSLLAIVPAATGITPCGAVNEPGAKILLDDIVASDPALTALANTLAAQLEQNLEQLRTEAGLDVKVRACQARRPQGPSEFQRTMTGELLDREVVLEVWGSAVAMRDNAGPYNQTEIGYLIVPVRYYEFDSPQPQGAFVIPQRSKPLQSVDDLVRLLNQSGRLGAYAALASGTVLFKSTALKSARWDPARKQLCRAASMLEAIQANRTTADRELAAYGERLASEVLNGARLDPEYGGAMKVLPVGAACPK